MESLQIPEELKKIKKVVFNSEKEFVKFVDEMVIKLKDTKSEWDDRVEYLVQFQGACLAGAPSTFESFTTQLQKLKEPIANQVLELRSTVPREATLVISCLAHTMPLKQFEPFADYWIPTLIKLLKSTGNVYIDAANRGMRVIIEKCRMEKSFPLVVQPITVKDPSTGLRTKCAEYLTLYLRRALDSDEECDLPESVIENAIKAAIQDALPDVRTFGKQAFSEYQTLRPKKAQAIYDALDPSLQKRLKSTTAPTSMAKSQKLGPSVKTKSSTQPLAQTLKVPVSSKIEEIPTDIAFHHTYPNTKTPGKAQRVQFPKVEKENEFNSTNTDYMTDIYKIAKSITEDFPETSSAPQRVPVKTAPVPPKPIVNVQPKRVPSNPTISVATPQLTKPPMVTVPSPIVSTVLSTPMFSNPLPTTTVPTIPVTVSAPKRVPITVQGPPPTSTAAVSAPARRVAVVAPPEPEPELEFVSSVNFVQILANTEHLDWNIRKDAFEQLYDEAQNPNVEFRIQAEKIVNAVTKHIVDSHFKVALQALELLRFLITCLPKEIEIQLEKVLPNLLKTTVDSKTSVQSVAYQVLSELAKTMDCNVLYMNLVKIADTLTNRCQLICLDTMQDLIQRCDLITFDNAGQMRFTLQKMCTVIFKDTSAKAAQDGTRKKALELLKSLHSKAQPVFLTQLLTLSLTTQLELRKQLVSFIPNLDFEVAKSLPDPRPQHLVAQMPVNVPVVQPLSSVVVVDMKNEAPKIESITGHFDSQVDELSTILSDTCLEDLPEHSENLLSESETSNVSTTLVAPKSPGNSVLKAIFIPPAPKTRVFESLRNTFVESLSQNDLESRLKQIETAIDVEFHSVWDVDADLVFNFLDSCMSRKDMTKIRESAINILEKVMIQIPHKFLLAHVATCVRLVLAASLDPTTEVSKIGEQLFGKLSSIPLIFENVDQCIKYLMPLTQNVKFAPLAITLASEILKKQPQDKIMEVLPTIFPGLMELLRNPSADVRKSSVFCIVDLYAVLGDSLYPFLSQLPTTQAKLVAIYLNKRLNVPLDPTLSK